MQSKDLLFQTRRHFFQQAGFGIGSLALGSLLNNGLFAQAANPMAPKAPHFAPKAKRIIFLFMAGAPPQPAPFHYKPPPNRYDCQPLPPHRLNAQRLPLINSKPQ